MMFVTEGKQNMDEFQCYRSCSAYACFTLVEEALNLSFCIHRNKRGYASVNRPTGIGYAFATHTPLLTKLA